MCGIAGIVYNDRDRPVEPDLLSRMARALVHRGPDDHGIWTDDGVGFSHRRLSIIDLSPAGRQPIPNEDESVWVVFNGEIYNFRELRRDLDAAGHRFRSATDTEVIVHLYEEEGPACVERLHGMFAFALWDVKRRQLLLARDRIGKKPLKYSEIDGGLVFASELKAILDSGTVDRELDLDDIDRYLTLGYVPSPGTGFARIRKLPPGHTLLWRDGDFKIERYWSLDFRRKHARTDREWKEAIRGTVQQAVSRRLVSDVPLGVFLSGGIDSSIVTACMAEASDRPVETFSIGFEQQSQDELPYARKVAELYSTNHHELIVRADDVDLLPVIAEAYEEPFGDTSALPTYLLARETRRFVTVALNGDGGDEGFAGYQRYARIHRWSRWGSLIRGSGLHAITGLASRADRWAPRWLGRRIEGVHEMSDVDLATRYAWLTRVFSLRERRRLYREPFAALAMPGRERICPWMEDERSGVDDLDRLLFTDSMTYLPDDLLVKVDIASMANSLEARSPLLDHEVLELAASIPAGAKLRHGSLKRLLKEAFRDRLPAELLRQPKRGFGSPVQEWFRGPRVPFARETLLAQDARVREWLRPAAVTGMIESHQNSQEPRGSQLWVLIMLELWLRNVVGRSSPRHA
jgi:asparagine synthase (glutamine-hydrolysing)